MPIVNNSVVRAPRLLELITANDGAPRAVGVSYLSTAGLATDKVVAAAHRTSERLGAPGAAS